MNIMISQIQYIPSTLNNDSKFQIIGIFFNTSKYLKFSKNPSKYLKNIYPLKKGVLGVELGDALEGTDVIVGRQEAV